MPIEITTLIENSQGEHTGLITEHGLSFLIETGKSSTLFDTGRSNAFLKNAKLLGKRLDGVAHVVLSHGHYDHSGGFQSFVQSRADRAFTLHTGEGFFAEKYARFNASYQYLGNDFDQEYIKEQGITHHTITGKTEIVPGVWALTHFKRNHAEETIHPRFVLRGQAGWVEDRFDDEVLLVVETGKGLVMLVGCSHPGILNMLDSVHQAFNKPVYALLGGTHLVEADRPRVARSIQVFQEKGIEVLGINHCSGAEAIKLATEHSSIHFHNSTGSCLIL
jgi:7,8-dihydropterin-6-yl-methyl-4-(beta-D-ribofuranosyl)aminobenzene 5'-phosphate synthase